MKWPAVDLIKLFNEGNHDLWNRWLTYCHQSHNINELKKIRYGIQAGMSDASKKKLNDEKTVQFFVRLNRSIEITLKKILREKYPNPNDNPTKADKYDIAYLSAKRLRDQELELFLKESSY